MLDIVFGDSACGSLKQAQHFGEGDYSDGCIAVSITHSDGSSATAEELAEARRSQAAQMRRAWEEAEPLGGDPADVYGFALSLSTGDISEDIPGPGRRAALETLYSAFQFLGPEDWLTPLTRDAEAALKTVLTRAAGGEGLRIWYSDLPDDLCGFYWLASHLDRLEQPCGPVRAVKLPAFEAREDGTIECKSGWGELSPEEWRRYLPLERPVSRDTLRFCAGKWRQLQQENAPLRAVLNGRLMSVSSDFYDGFIRREIDLQPDTFQEALVVGSVLGHCQLGISDCWVDNRIQDMIENGELSIVTPAGPDTPRYHRVLKKQ